ncbi:MAG: hypothetical protein K2L13_01595, partial [Opitutales bacterium]|nr:hypothetical protein [Opitutales bacterium]
IGEIMAEPQVTEPQVTSDVRPMLVQATSSKGFVGSICAFFGMSKVNHEQASDVPATKMENSKASSTTSRISISQRIMQECRNFNENFKKLPFKVRIEMIVAMVSSAVSFVTIGKIIGVACTVGKVVGVSLCMVSPITIMVAVLSFCIAFVAISLVVSYFAAALNRASEVADQAEDLWNKFNDLKDANEAQKANINKVKVENDRFQKKIEGLKLSLEEQKQVLEAQNMRLLSTAEQQKKTLKELNDSAVSFARQVQTCTRKSVEALQHDIDSANTQLKKLATANEVFRNGINELRASYAEKQKPLLAIIQNQHEIMADALDKVSKINDHEENCYGQRLKILMNAFPDAMKLNETIKDKVLELNRFLNEKLENFGTTISKELRDLAKNIRQAKARLAEQQAELDRLNAELEKKKNSLKNLFGVAERDIQLLNVQIREMKSTISKSNENLLNLQSNYENLAESFDGLDQALTAAQQGQSNINSKIGEAQKVVQDLRYSAQNLAVSSGGGHWVASMLGACAASLLVGGSGGILGPAIAGVASVGASHAYDLLVSGARKLINW